MTETMAHLPPAEIKQYLCDSDLPCHAVIYNHTKYDENLGVKDRDGTENDLEKLRSVLLELRFEIEVHKDLTCQQIYTKQQEYADDNYAKYGGFMAVVLTHGLKGGWLLAKDGCYDIKNIWEPFINVQSLQNKPKIFIFQACRSDPDSSDELHIRINDDPAPQVCAGMSSVKSDAKPMVQPEVQQETEIPYPPDFLFVSCTVEGRIAIREWYIPLLCDQLRDWPRVGGDLLGVLTRANKMVIRYHQASTSNLQQPSNTATTSSEIVTSTNGAQAGTFQTQTNVEVSQTATFTSSLLRLIYYSSRELKKEIISEIISEPKIIKQIPDIENSDDDIETDGECIQRGSEDATDYRWVDYKYRGRALIYNDDDHRTVAEDVAQAMAANHLTPIISLIESQDQFLSKLHQDIDSDFKDEGCLAVIFLCTLLESLNLTVLPEIKKLLLTSRQLTLAAKPKLCILLAQTSKGGETDDVTSDGDSPVIYLEHANDHSDCLFIVGYSTEFLSTLTRYLRDSRGENIYEIVTKAMSVTYSSTKLAPYFESTLQLELAFTGETQMITEIEIQNRSNSLSQSGIMMNVMDPIASFAGRQDELRKLNQLYLDNKNINHQYVLDIVVTGEKSIGKTQLINKFIAEHKDDFINQIVIDASNSDSIQNSIQELQTKCGVEDIDTIYQVLKQKGNTVIFIDNITDLSDIEGVNLRDKLSGRDGNYFFVIGASRNTVIPNCLIVEGLSKPEAVQYLKDNLNLINDSNEDTLKEKLESLAESAQRKPDKLKKVYEAINSEIEGTMALGETFEITNCRVEWSEQNGCIVLMN